MVPFLLIIVLKILSSYSQWSEIVSEYFENCSEINNKSHQKVGDCPSVMFWYGQRIYFKAAEFMAFMSPLILSKYSSSVLLLDHRYHNNNRVWKSVQGYFFCACLTKINRVSLETWGLFNLGTKHNQEGLVDSGPRASRAWVNCVTVGGGIFKILITLFSLIIMFVEKRVPPVGGVPIGAPNYGQANSTPIGTISVPFFSECQISYRLLPTTHKNNDRSL